MTSFPQRSMFTGAAARGQNLRGLGVTAVLGPTNTGKTHLAIERMLGHESGLIGLPLRLLAREVYQRLVARAGVGAVALITGEEKIKPKHPRYWVSTVEAMPRDLDVAFVAVDEVQLLADADRGHIFTDAVLHRRGKVETLLLGAATAQPLLEHLLPGLSVLTRPRLSKLSYAGDRKIMRLPPRSAIIAFSTEEVYAIAEFVRRQHGGAAVVLGSLSPRTRNAQVAMFQAGEVDHIVATDAIGMGLNLEIDHVAFAADRKFDGRIHRRLFASEIAQIAGRAGRAQRDGTFGTTGRCTPFEEDLIKTLEEHAFEPIQAAQWRNSALDFRSIESLDRSLNQMSPESVLQRARRAEDEITFDIAISRSGVRDLTKTEADVRRLWDLCQLPDYRKASLHVHADLVVSLFETIQKKGAIASDWFKREVEACDRVEGDIDALSWRLAQIRTWSYCANRPDWLSHPVHWQNVTRALEDRLSDALHERLMQRFVDRRTSVLMRRLRENAMLESQVSATGDVLVEGQHIGRLEGFRFTADPNAEGAEAKALRAAAAKALAGEIETRATRLSTASDEQFTLSLDGVIRFIGEPVAVLQAGARMVEPRFLILADEQLTGLHRDMVDARLVLWLKTHVTKLLGPLFALENAETLTGLARGIAFQVAEALGILDRAVVANDVRALDQTARADLRKAGIRFGAHHIFVPGLMKPGPRSLAAQLFALSKGQDSAALRDVSHLAFSGRTSIPLDPAIDKDLYRVAGFKLAGPRAIRVDILERLADLIRPAIAYRPGVSDGLPPPGAADGDGFTVTGAMTSLVGCAGADFGEILKSLGYRSEQREGPAITVALKPTAALTPIVAPVASEADTAQDAESVIEVGSADPIEAVEPEPAADMGLEAAPSVAESASTDALAQDESQPEAMASDESASDEPAAPVLTEIWRVSRQERNAHRHPRGDRRPDGEKRGDGEKKPWQGRRENRPAQPAMAAGEAQATSTGERTPRDQERQNNKRQRFEGFGKDGFKGGKPQNRSEGGRSEGGRPDHRGGKPGGQQAPRVFDAKPKVEKPLDPDSPFAKLLALKQQMEGKS